VLSTVNRDYKTKIEDVSTSFVTDQRSLVASQTEECTTPALSEDGGNAERNAAAAPVPR